jgi:hypothetical protein
MLNREIFFEQAFADFSELNLGFEFAGPSRIHKIRQIPQKNLPN